MKNAQELARYTHINMGEMRRWWNTEYKHVESILNQWIKDYHIGSKEDNELVKDIAVYDLEWDVIQFNYMKALLSCGEEYTPETVTGAIDILLQEMADTLTDHMRRQYPCLSHIPHYVVMRANNRGECVMYIGPYLSITGKETVAYRLFGDGGVFMTQGFDACRPLFNKIDFGL